MWSQFTREIIHPITWVKRTDQVHTYTHTHILWHHPKPTAMVSAQKYNSYWETNILLKKYFLCVYPTFFFFKKLLISLWKMKSNEVSLKNESFCTLHMQELNQDMWKSVYVLWYNAFGKRISFFSDFWWRTPWKSVPARTSSSKWHFIS